MLDLQFLGTSAGIPTKSRNVTALAVGQTANKPWLLIDCGEATQQQLLHTHWSANTLSAICITHVHGDHCYGLPGMLASAGLNKRTQPLTIIAPLPLWQWLEHTIALTDLFLSFELQFVDVTTLLEERFYVDDFEISAVALSHRVPSYAYKIRHRREVRQLDRDALFAHGLPAGPLWGMLQNGQDVYYEGRNYPASLYLEQHEQRVCALIGGDNDSPSLLQAACDGVQVLVHEATYTQDIADKVGAFPMHSSAKQTAEFAYQAAIPNLVLTHFSARYGDAQALEPLLAEAKRYYHGHVHLAEDFAQYRLLPSGEFQPLTTRDA
ncbi:ribonuclease Z [Vitreoscilla massiliensis]|uniref:Ribonuclease Z n=1 Tax=Vitreoscilla massiliensis TaxID=1689272 RepID=A0ABY4DXV8_9NEIS|nr:ribonuclease Z [Vitreoscilla massiliensis]UOO88358.1 ribonuclease Z [Vitreoscilla massiliensis]